MFPEIRTTIGAHTDLALIASAHQQHGACPPGMIWCVEGKRSLLDSRYQRNWYVRNTKVRWSAAVRVLTEIEGEKRNEINIASAT